MLSEEDVPRYDCQGEALLAVPASSSHRHPPWFPATGAENHLVTDPLDLVPTRLVETSSSPLHRHTHSRPPAFIGAIMNSVAVNSTGPKVRGAGTGRWPRCVHQADLKVLVTWDGALPNGERRWVSADEELGSRAGMAPAYVSYLEEQSTAWVNLWAQCPYPWKSRRVHSEAMRDLNDQFPDKEDSDILQSVRSLMSTAVAFVDSDASLRVVVETMVEESLGALIVLGPEGPSRIISERDVVRALAGDADLDGTLAIDVATTGIVSADPDDTVIEAARLMAEHTIRHVPVMSTGGVIGMVSARDVLRVLADEVRPLG